jgi:hypothetical protein
VPIFSSLDKDQIKVVIDKVTQWLDLAEEGDQMTLPGIAGRQSGRPFLPTWEHAGVVAVYQKVGDRFSFLCALIPNVLLMTESEAFAR